MASVTEPARPGAFEKPQDVRGQVIGPLVTQVMSESRTCGVFAHRSGSHPVRRLKRPDVASRRPVVGTAYPDVHRPSSARKHRFVRGRTI